MSHIDYAAKDRLKGQQLLDVFIQWTNADDEDRIVLGRTDCCYMRDEIERLRDLVTKLSLHIPTNQFLDPMRRDYRGRELEPHIVDEIVEGDKTDLDNTDILLAFCPKPSVGTSMEILYFWERGGRVVIVHPNPNPSPWLVKHSDAVFPDFESAYAYLMEK